MRILFVEDQPEFSKTVTAAFLSDHAVRIAPSIADGLRELQHGSYDVLLVDYDLSDGKGTILVRRARAAGFRGHVVAVSSHAEGNDALLAAGADVACPKSRFNELPAILYQMAGDQGPAYWRPRVMRHRRPDGATEYAIHDVYFYSDGNVASYTQAARSPRFGEIADLQRWVHDTLASGVESVACGDLGYTHQRSDLEMWMHNINYPPIDYGPT